MLPAKFKLSPKLTEVSLSFTAENNLIKLEKL
jgi:hypothetical protein